MFCTFRKTLLIVGIVLALSLGSQIALQRKAKAVWVITGADLYLTSGKGWGFFKATMDACLFISKLTLGVFLPVCFLDQNGSVMLTVDNLMDNGFDPEVAKQVVKEADRVSRQMLSKQVLWVIEDQETKDSLRIGLQAFFPQVSDQTVDALSALHGIVD